MHNSIEQVKNKRIKPKAVVVGNIYPTNDGDLEILEYLKGYRDKKGKEVQAKAKVSFVGYDEVLTPHISSIRNGTVKNPMKPSVYGVGFVGAGEYKPSVNSKLTEAYNSWHTRMQSCYDPKYLIKNPTYKDCEVTPVWHNFQNYAEWFYTNPHWKRGYHVDKDLKIQGNKLYSPDTCFIVSQRINKLLITSNAARGKYMTGVSTRSSGRYRAYCQDGAGKQHCLGTYDTELEAHQAYCNYKYKLIKELANLPKNSYIKECLLNWIIPQY